MSGRHTSNGSWHSSCSRFEYPHGIGRISDRNPERIEHIPPRKNYHYHVRPHFLMRGKRQSLQWYGWTQPYCSSIPVASQMDIGWNRQKMSRQNPILFHRYRRIHLRPDWRQWCGLLHYSLMIFHARDGICHLAKGHSGLSPTSGNCHSRSFPGNRIQSTRYSLRSEHLNLLCIVLYPILGCRFSRLKGEK